MSLYILGFSFELMDMLEMLFCVLCHSRPENVMLMMCFLSVGLNPLLLVWYNEIFFSFSFNWQSFRKPVLCLCSSKTLGFWSEMGFLFPLAVTCTFCKIFFNKWSRPPWQCSFLGHLRVRLINMQKSKVAHIHQEILSDPFFLAFLSGGLV